MEDPHNTAVLLHTWTDVKKMTLDEIMELSIAQVAHLIVTIDDDAKDHEDYTWRASIVNTWNAHNISKA